MESSAVKPECLRCGQRVGWVGVWANLAMVVMKIIVGISAGSRACLADALHSGSNIVTAFAIFISRKLTSKPSDETHPYGHGKVEFIAAGLVSVLILLFTAFLVVTSLEHIIYKPVPPPHLSALLVALVSIVANEMLFRYFRCVGTQLRSQTIIANAWANRADCFSSAAVVIGVLGSRLGFHHLDPVAAVVVAAIIMKVCIGCIKDSVAGLMDRSVPEETVEALTRVIEGVDQVEGIGHLRTRLMGDKIFVDLGIRVAAGHTVNECERIKQRLRRSVMENVQGVGQILVEFDSVHGEGAG